MFDASEFCYSSRYGKNRHRPIVSGIMPACVHNSSLLSKSEISFEKHALGCIQNFIDKENSTNPMICKAS